MAGTVRWEVAAGRVLGPARHLICGIVNVTPDSFYDGGRHFDAGAAVAHGRRLAEEGAHVLDVGGESTRPGAAPVDEAEELRRVLPVIRELAALAGTPREDAQGLYPAVSVDTFKAGVAAAALQAGAAVVNDVSACRFDPGLLDVLVQHKPGYVLMHSLGRPDRMQVDPRYGDVVAVISAFFEERMNALVRAGLPESRIVLDPGVGFGKLLEHNLAILKNVETFFRLGRPVFVGLSNKSLWGGLLGLAPQERGEATQVATALLAARGVALHRVHDVAATRRTLAVVRELS